MLLLRFYIPSYSRFRYFLNVALPTSRLFFFSCGSLRFFMPMLNLNDQEGYAWTCVEVKGELFFRLSRYRLKNALRFQTFFFFPGRLQVSRDQHEQVLFIVWSIQRNVSYITRWIFLAHAARVQWQGQIDSNFVLLLGNMKRKQWWIDKKAFCSENFGV